MEEHFLRSQYRVSLFMKILRSPGTQDFSISILCYNPPSMWRGRQILIKPSSCSSQSNANTSIHGSSGLQFGTLNATPVQNLSHLTLLWFPQCVLACVSHHHWSASCHGHRCNEMCLKLSRREGHYWGTSPSNRHVHCVSATKPTFVLETFLLWDSGACHCKNWWGVRGLGNRRCANSKKEKLVRIYNQETDNSISNILVFVRMGWSFPCCSSQMCSL